MEARTDFERLVREHQSAVCAIAYAVVRNRARSEELAQEAFLVAWRYRDRVPVLTANWVCAISRNLARNAARRRVEVAMDAEPIGETRNARDELIDREREAQALAALAALPERYREAVVLYYRGDESFHDVATALGVSEATARQRVHRGRAKLRDALAPVVTTLGATKPGAAFTAACVTAWLAGGGSTAHAAPPSEVLPASVPWLVPVIAGAIASAAIVVGAAFAVGGGNEPHRVIESSTIAAPANIRSADISGLRARFPASRAAQVPRGFAAVGGIFGGGGPAAAHTVDFDFMEAPLHDMGRLIAHELDAPIWVDPALDAKVNIRARNLPVMDALDEIVAQAGAIRTEVAALKLVKFGGRTDAAHLGGDAMSVDVKDAPLGDILAMIEAHLHMPIGRVEFQITVRDANGEIIGELGEAAAPRVTLSVRDVPAGAVLERVLAQTGLGYELTTGFAITPDPDLDAEP